MESGRKRRLGTNLTDNLYCFSETGGYIYRRSINECYFSIKTAVTETSHPEPTGRIPDQSGFRKFRIGNGVPGECLQRSGP